MGDITDEQAAIYDRQIRIWGAGVQKRLTDARVLVLGCTPLAAEVTKNFILAGVGSLVLIDDTPAVNLPMTFLTMHNVPIPDQATAAEAYAAGLQAMNPLVKVTAAAGSASGVPDEDVVKDFELVICFGQNCGFQKLVNEVCRKCNVKFMCAASRSGIVWAFSDLLSHYCSLNIDQNSDSAKKQVSLDYISLQECVTRNWLSMPKPDQRKINGFLGPWTVIALFEIQEGRLAEKGDTQTILDNGNEIMRKHGVPSKFWDAGTIEQYLSGLGELAPANAIAGGFIANDVVRSVSGAGLPSFNVLMYSIVTNITQVHNLANSESAVVD